MTTHIYAGAGYPGTDKWGMLDFVGDTSNYDVMAIAGQLQYWNPKKLPVDENGIPIANPTGQTSDGLIPLPPGGEDLGLPGPFEQQPPDLTVAPAPNPEDPGINEGGGGIIPGSGIGVITYPDDPPIAKIPGLPFEPIDTTPYIPPSPPLVEPIPYTPPGTQPVDTGQTTIAGVKINKNTLLIGALLLILLVSIK